jgi:hypothetical protein
VKKEKEKKGQLRFETVKIQCVTSMTVTKQVFIFSCLLHTSAVYKMPRRGCNNYDISEFPYFLHLCLVYKSKPNQTGYEIIELKRGYVFIVQTREKKGVIGRRERDSQFQMQKRGRRRCVQKNEIVRIAKRVGNSNLG